jgi:hypothetical protein
MTDTVRTMHGMPVFVVADKGAPLTREQDAVDLIGNTWGQREVLFAIPAERLPAEFFDLSTGLAGALLQKFVGYRRRVAVLGDISAHTARSSALASLVHESNRGTDVWFLSDLVELDERLRAETHRRGGAG